MSGELPPITDPFAVALAREQVQVLPDRQCNKIEYLGDGKDYHVHVRCKSEAVQIVRTPHGEILDLCPKHVQENNNEFARLRAERKSKKEGGQ